MATSSTNHVCASFSDAIFRVDGYSGTHLSRFWENPRFNFKLQWIVLGFTLIIFMFAIQSFMQMIIWSVLVIYVFRFFVFYL